jgi:hypothetical protein
MPYRRLSSAVTWHWCHNCSGWPAANFLQREDKPPTWTGASLCSECATRDSRCACTHSITLRAGLLSDGPIPSLDQACETR